MKSIVKILGIVATAGMFVVLVMGATVTNTGSEHGCGRSWPLCHGKLIPQFAVSTAIEFSHRAAVGIETMLILVFAAGALFLYGRRREMQILAVLMVGFLFVQAGLGAWAVMYPQLSPVLALHFGVSLISFASVLLATMYILEAGGTDVLRDRVIPSGLRWYVWLLAAFSYVVVYLGAYVRHTDSDQACTGWPLCNGHVIPVLEGDVLRVFVHRVAALALVLAVVGLVYWCQRLRSSRPDLYRASLVAVATVILQSLSGAVVVFTRLDLFSALSHAALAGILFASLAYLCVHVLQRGSAVAGVPAPAVGRRSAVDTAGMQG